MFRKLAKILLLLLILPYGLVLVYTVVPPVSMPVIGKALNFEEFHWRWRSFDNISPSLPKMIIAAEDGQFCNHDGVDWKAFRKTALRAHKKGKLTKGASTIAMQTAKNLFLWPLPRIIRKPLEIPLALWIDLIWSKQRIIEVYMNIAQMGDGVYGAEAAARQYFKKTAKQLTPQESALIAASLPNPVKRKVNRPSKYVAAYAGAIKNRAPFVPAKCVY